jgi:hypothetical protein
MSPRSRPLQCSEPLSLSAYSLDRGGRVGSPMLKRQGEHIAVQADRDAEVARLQHKLLGREDTIELIRRWGDPESLPEQEAALAVSTPVFLQRSCRSPWAARCLGQQQWPVELMEVCTYSETRLALTL